MSFIGDIVGGIGDFLGDIVSFVLSPLEPPELGAGQNQTPARTLTVRQSVIPRQFIYGKVRTGGGLSYITTSDDGAKLHAIYVLASHEVESIGTVYINDEPIYTDQINGSGEVTSGTYANLVRIKKYLGTPTQTADADLVSEVTEWTTDHRNQGVAYVYIRFTADSNVFDGRPNVSCEVKGAKITDSRTSTTGYSTNPALCARDFITNDFYGFKEIEGRLNDTSFNAAANICDEFVDTLEIAATVDSITGDALTLINADEINVFQDGDRVEFTTTGTAPTGLTAGGTYYVIVTKERVNPEIKLAATYSDAMAGTAITLSDSGSGTATVTKNGEPRYTANGIFSMDSQDYQYDTLRDLTLSAGGTLSNVSGAWNFKAGAWESSSLSIDDSMIIGNIRTQSRHSGNSRFNAVQGAFFSPQSLGEEDIYPIVQNSTYTTADGGIQKIETLDLPLTTRPQTCQRIASVFLNAHRRQISVELDLNLKGTQVTAGDVVDITNARYGWTNKTFKVENTSLQVNGAGLSVTMALRETDADVFTFDPGTEETLVNAAPRTTLPNAFNVQPPSNLILASGTDNLYLKKDGTVVSRIKVSWDASVTVFLQHYEVQFKRSSDGTFEPSKFISPELTNDFIWDVEDGEDYDVRVRARNRIGVDSAWVTVSNHTVIGKTEPPADVEDFSAQQNGNVVNFRWAQVNEPDIAGYEIRFRPQGSGFDFDLATTLTRETKGTLVTNGGLPPGDFTVAIKAIDTSGNYSVNPTTFDITVVNANDIVFSSQENPRWAGTLTNLRRHDVDGTLVLKDQAMASGNNFDVFDNYLINPVSGGSYEASELDLGYDAKGVRVYSETSAGLGAGVTVGSPDPVFSIDYRDGAGSYDGFENWTLGTINGRFFKFKISINSATGKMFVNQFEPVIDVQERVERGTQVVGIGGTTVTFNSQFNVVPQITTSVDGASALYAVHSNKTATSFDLQVFNSSGTDVGGTVDWTAIGG